MNKHLFAFSKFIGLLLVAIILLVFAFKGVDLQEIFNDFLKAKWIWISVSLLISLLALYIRSQRWLLLIQSTKHSSTVQKTFYALCIGYLANLAFPRLGEVSRCSALYKSDNIPFNVLLGTVVIERIVDVLSLLVCFVLVMIIEFNRIGSFMMNSIVQPLLSKLHHAFSSPIAIVLLVIILVAVFLFFRLVVFRKKLNKHSKFSDLFKGFVVGLNSIKNLNKPWLFLFQSVLIWVLYYGAVYVCFFALPFTENLGGNAALFLLVAGGIGMSAPVQGGIGAYHLLVSQGLMVYGLSKEQGLAFATLVHSLQLVLVIFLGALSLLLLFSKRKTSANPAAA